MRYRKPFLGGLAGILFGAFLLSCASLASGITGEEIIRRVDANLTYDSAYLESEMVIRLGDQVRTKRFFSYARGRDESFAEFTAPPRDKGVKYLKIGDNMWMYLPSVDKIIKIAGHMLRQSMMGSDFSYEDALESSDLLDKYEATLAGEEGLTLTEPASSQKAPASRSCYVLDLVAKVKDITYYRRKIWVDKEYFIPLRQELFAISGKKLKVLTLGDIRRFGARYYPLYYTLQNLLRRDSLTEMSITRARFDLAVPDEYFSVGHLTK